MHRVHEMDRSNILTLVKETKSKNEYGVWETKEEKRDVYCNVQSVTASEFFDGGRNGLNPEYRFTIFYADYEGEKIGIWQRVNAFIFEEIAKEADLIFDAAAVLKKSDEEPHKAKYGGHPDAEGCKVWGEALAPVLKDFMERI